MWIIGPLLFALALVYIFVQLFLTGSVTRIEFVVFFGVAVAFWLVGLVLTWKKRYSARKH